MSKDRLTVSTEGMRELHAAREPWSLVKELIQNSWDEAPNATVCDVIVAPLMERTNEVPRRALITVEDDGGGFSNIEDAYTLMRSTSKRSDPTKRGRFNIGEKEIVAVSVEAIVETVGYTVSFPKEGGRTIKRNKRTSGTRIQVVMPWGKRKREGLIEMLKQFRPTDCRLIVNGEEVAQPDPLATRVVTLPTVLQDGIGEPMRPTNRKTRIDVLKPAGKPFLYEMGIPVQEIDLAYSVDVLQKIPMPPNRDTVGTAYMKHIAAEVLNATYEILEPDGFAETWVRSGLESDRIEKDAVKATVTKRYGNKVAMWSPDTNANMLAAESGYEVLHPRSMSREERENLKRMAGVTSTAQLFGRTYAPAEDVPTNEIKKKFADWVKMLATRCELTANVRFILLKGSDAAAQCTANTRTPTVTFNTCHLNDDWFASRGPEQLRLIIHELAHAVADKPMEHGPAWGEACCAVAVRVLPLPQDYDEVVIKNG